MQKKEGRWRGKKERENFKRQTLLLLCVEGDISEGIPMQNHLLDKGIAKAYQENQVTPTIVN